VGSSGGLFGSQVPAGVLSGGQIPDMGVLGALVRSGAGGATFGFANNIAAAGDATIPLDAGSSTATDWLARYHQNLAWQQQVDSSTQAQHPTAWKVGDLAGQAANPVYNVALPWLTRMLPDKQIIPDAWIDKALDKADPWIDRADAWMRKAGF
jgi:hypothetical protein